MAFIAGAGLSEIKNTKWVYIILLIVSIENIANQAHLFRTKKTSLSLLHLEEILDQNGIKPNDLIAINGFHVHLATPMYFAHRKGWNVPGDGLTSTEQTETLKQQGCQYIVILKNAFGGDIHPPLQKIFDSPDFAIYKL
jgi:hypothetical protein